MSFELDQFQKINSHIKGHREINFEERRKFLESIKKKVTAVRPIPVKKFRKEKRKMAIKRKRDRKLAQYRERVMAALEDCGVNKNHCRNIAEAETIEGINKYL